MLRNSLFSKEQLEWSWQREKNSIEQTGWFHHLSSSQSTKPSLTSPWGDKRAFLSYKSQNQAFLFCRTEECLVNIRKQATKLSSLKSFMQKWCFRSWYTCHLAEGWPSVHRAHRHCTVRQSEGRRDSEVKGHLWIVSTPEASLSYLKLSKTPYTGLESWFIR